MDRLIIRVGNSGKVCKNCKKLENEVKKAVKLLSSFLYLAKSNEKMSSLEKIMVKIEHINITDIEAIKKYGSLMAPALIINDLIISDGKILNYNQIKKILEDFLKNNKF